MSLKNWVTKAYNKLHPAYEAGKNFGIPEHWLAGLVYVENSRLKPSARRFEAHVYKQVQYVRWGQQAHHLPGLNNNPIRTFIQKEATDVDLRYLASSFGLGQIMGYHYFIRWGIKPDQLMDMSFERSLRLTLEFMASGLRWAKTYEQLLRWYNTGSINGKTHNADYVARAVQVAQLYKAHMDAQQHG